MSANLQFAIDRLKSGNYSPEDVNEIASAIQEKRMVWASGDGSVGVDGDASDARIVTGKRNIIGDGNTVIYLNGVDTEVVQSVLDRGLDSSISNTIDSIDELVQQVRSRLREDLQRLYDTMPLWGISQPVPLSDLFVDVNLLEEPNSTRRDELDNLWQDFQQGLDRDSSYRSLDRIGLGQKLKRISGTEVLDGKIQRGQVECPKLMVLGKPGSGKTTYLQRFMTECNNERLQAERIPVLIQLRRFVQRGAEVSYNIKDYLVQRWKLSEVDVESILHHGKALVMFDGLDEVAGKNLEQIVSQIQEFVENYPQNPTIVTCRTQSHNSQITWKSLGFSYVEVADFNRAQVEAFVEHWFQAITRNVETGKVIAEDFLTQLFQELHKPIQDLAITPILLSLTCAVFHQTGKFYSKRYQLYQEGLELLLEHWDESRGIDRDEVYRSLSIQRKLDLLSHLAMKKFERSQYVLFDQRELEGYIADFLEIEPRDSRAVLRSIESQHGLLIERAQKIWSFSHLTFQEYLVAYFIKHRFTSEDTIKPFLSYIFNHHWKEVYLSLVDMLDDPKQLIEMIFKEIELFSLDEDISQILRWIESKLLITDRESSTVIRSFYLSHLLGYDYKNLCYLISCSSEVKSEISKIRNIDLIADRIFQLLKELKKSYSSLKLNFTQIRENVSKLLKLLSKLERVISDIPSISTKIQDSIAIIPDPSSDKKIFHRWYVLNSKQWIDELETIVLGLKILGDGCLKNNRVDKIRYYYDANKLLACCVASLDEDFNEFREGIKQKMLVPVVETEGRSNII